MNTNVKSTIFPSISCTSFALWSMAISFEMSLSQSHIYNDNPFEKKLNSMQSTNTRNLKASRNQFNFQCMLWAAHCCYGLSVCTFWFPLQYSLEFIVITTSIVHRTERKQRHLYGNEHRTLIALVALPECGDRIRSAHFMPLTIKYNQLKLPCENILDDEKKTKTKVISKKEIFFFECRQRTYYLRRHMTKSHAYTKSCLLPRR